MLVLRGAPMMMMPPIIYYLSCRARRFTIRLPHFNRGHLFGNVAGLQRSLLHSCCHHVKIAILAMRECFQCGEITVAVSSGHHIGRHANMSTTVTFYYAGEDYEMIDIDFDASGAWDWPTSSNWDVLSPRKNIGRRYDALFIRYEAFPPRNGFNATEEKAPRAACRRHSLPRAILNMTTYNAAKKTPRYLRRRLCVRTAHIIMRDDRASSRHTVTLLPPRNHVTLSFPSARMVGFSR